MVHPLDLTLRQQADDLDALTDEVDVLRVDQGHHPHLEVMVVAVGDHLGVGEVGRPAQVEQVVVVARRPFTVVAAGLDAHVVGVERHQLFTCGKVPSRRL